MFSQVCVKNSVQGGRGCIPAFTGQGCVSQHALGRVCVSQHALELGVSQHALGGGLCILALTGQGVCVSQHAMGRGCGRPPRQTLPWADTLG